MKYISTRDKSKEFDFKQVFLKGLADDGGLFIPKNLKKFSENEINEFSNLSYTELANRIIAPFVDDFISGKNLEELINKSCLLYTSPSPRDATLSRMPSSA